MHLDAVKQTEQPTINGSNGFHDVAEEVFDHWKDWQASEISHHRRLCCDIAREWTNANDFSELNGASLLTGPRWLRQKFTWGASSFPIYWCEAVQKKILDCGALAALAYEVFRSRGVRVLRAQMIQRFSDVSTFQWANSWSDGNALRWTHKDLIYHEGCAVITSDNDIKIWDASAGWWIDPKTRDGYGALLALRLSAAIQPKETYFLWDKHLLPVYKWVKLG